MISLPDGYLERLRRLAKKNSTTMEPVGVSPSTLVAMLDEILDQREELFRLAVCETVDQMILKDELEASGTPLPFRWRR